MARNNLEGMRFGKLTVIGYSHTGKAWRSFWKCFCDCGKKVVVAGRHLSSKKTLSCGCMRTELLRKEKTTHGKSGTPTYNVWCSMIRRCRDPTVIGYHRWGGRGISVCERWLKFENFFDDMGHKPKNKSLDRINNDGHYEPSNCRWATRLQQTKNRSSRKGLKGRNARVPIVKVERL